MGREESETPDLDSFPCVFCCKGKQRTEGRWVEGTQGQDNFFEVGEMRVGGCIAKGMIRQGGNTAERRPRGDFLD